MKITALAVASFCVFSASAQTIERQFRIAGSPSAMHMQELATAVRTVFDIPSLSIDASSSTLKVSGPAELVNGVEWFVNDLDQPADIRARAPHEYSIAGARVPVVRAFYLKAPAGLQYLQEMLTVIRTVAEIQKIFSCSSPAVLLARGSKADMDLTAWLIGEIDNGADGASELHRFRPDSGNGGSARIFFEPDLSSRQISAKLAILRGEYGVQHAFAVSSRHAIAVLGTAEQLLAAEKLFAVRS